MAKTESTEVKVFVNPFIKGVTYDVFLTAVGSKKVEDYCKDNLTPEQIEWLVEDLKHYKNNKNK